MPPLHPTPDLAPESNPVPCAKVQPMDLQATFPADSLRQGPTPGPSGKFSTPFFAPRSSLWTFRQVFNTIPCAKVQLLDLQATFRPHSLRQGPTPGPSGKFSTPFLTSRSNSWTFKHLFGPIPYVKVQPLDLQASFQHHSLRQGPTPGPSGKFSTPFLTSRSNSWTFRQVFNTIPHAKVQPLDLQATFRPHSLRQGPTPGPSSNFSAPFLASRSNPWTFRQVFGLWQVGGVANNRLAINNLLIFLVAKRNEKYL